MLIYNIKLHTSPLTPHLTDRYCSEINSQSESSSHHKPHPLMTDWIKRMSVSVEDATQDRVVNQGELWHYNTLWWIGWFIVREKGCVCTCLCVCVCWHFINETWNPCRKAGEGNPSFDWSWAETAQEMKRLKRSKRERWEIEQTEEERRL